jgi:hypothetical protein
LVDATPTAWILRPICALSVAQLPFIIVISSFVAAIFEISYSRFISFFILTRAAIQLTRMNSSEVNEGVTVWLMYLPHHKPIQKQSQTKGGGEQMGENGCWAMMGDGN